MLASSVSQRTLPSARNQPGTRCTASAAIAPRPSSQARVNVEKYAVVGLLSVSTIDHTKLRADNPTITASSTPAGAEPRCPRRPRAARATTPIRTKGQAR